MNATTIDIEALPKQIEFLEAREREVLYSGAFGAGKSRSVALKLAMRASVPGAREGLCRKHLVTLKATTLKTLLEPDGELQAVLPGGTYTHNKTEKTIRIKGGGEIQYFGLDDDSKIGSYNLTGCGIDEAVELTEKDWRQIRGRVRMNAQGLARQIYAACNPGPPSHFLAQRFGLAQGHTCKPNCRVIQTRSTDNWFLPDDYLEDLATFTGIARARYVDGRWVGAEGLVYDNWDPTVFVRERQGPWSRVIVGQDEGYTHPAAMLVVCVDEDGRVHIAREWYKTKQLEAEVIEAAQRLAAAHAVQTFVVDPAAAKLIAAMKNAGLQVEKANNDVFGGIQTVQNRLVVDGDGRPRLTVSPTCENLIREFEAYEWKEGKDQPKKEFDHALDALRYACMHLDGGRQIWTGDPETDQAIPDHDDDWMWTSLDSINDIWQGAFPQVSMWV